MKRAFFPITALSMALASGSAHGIPCQEVANMFNAGVPANIVASAVRDSGARYTASDIRCLAKAGVAASVLSVARSMSGGLEVDARAATTAPARRGIDETAFRGIKWGSRCSAVFPAQPVGQSKYRRSNERLMIGAVRLKSVEYHCTNDVFETAIVHLEQSQVTALKLALTAAWGPPEVMAGAYFWESANRVLVQNLYGTFEASVVQATLSPVGGQPHLIIMNNVVQQQQMEVDGARIQKDL